MERTAWTDERLDEALDAIRNGSVRHDEEIRDLRSEGRKELREFRAETRAEFADVRKEMREGFADVRKEMHDGFSGSHSDMRNGFAEMRGELDAFRQTVLRLGGGLMIGLVGVIAAVVARGA